jgi:hypothetical protein
MDKENIKGLDEIENWANDYYEFREINCPRFNMIIHCNHINCDWECSGWQD